MERFNLRDYEKKAREAVSEGIVLLRNEKETLPLKPGAKPAVFGRSQFCYYKSGTGSGGLVNTGHVKDILEAFEEEETLTVNQRVKGEYERWLADHPFDQGNGWAAEPWFQEEMPLTEELVKEAAQQSDTAIVVIGRTAGEDKDNQAEEGSYYLTRTEREMLCLVCRTFQKTAVLLNVGNIIDMNWVEEYRPGAVLYIWQGGQEGASGCMDLLTGRTAPSGKLPDTIAKELSDYPASGNYGNPDRNFYTEDIYVGYRYFETFAPERVLYPFGFGLSYTTFCIKNVRLREEQDLVRFTADVENTGAFAGKEVVQTYVCAPQGKLGKPVRSLCGFTKTGLIKPGETETVEIVCPKYYFSSYDDSGITGHKSSYVLEEGVYRFYLGTDVRSAGEAGTVRMSETKVVETLSEAMAPMLPFRRMKPEPADGAYRIGFGDVPLRTVSAKERMDQERPEEHPFTGNRGITLADVADGRAELTDFTAQLSDEDLCCIVRGEGMCSPKVTPGTAGAFGGVTESLKNFGIPVGCCADGPSGIRMDCGTIAFSMPNGACLAASFNELLLTEL